MQILSKDIKILTLSLLLRTMPKHQQTLLLKHFSPEVVRKLAEIERVTGGSTVERLDWSPFYQAYPELKRILVECKEEFKQKEIVKVAEAQRPQIKEYILMKLGRRKKGAPVLLSQEVTKIIDQYLTSYYK